jgi:hypothetical protein
MTIKRLIVVPFSLLSCSYSMCIFLSGGKEEFPGGYFSYLMNAGAY